jgi:hypothetical protein
MLFVAAPAAISRLLKRDFVVPVLFVTWAHLALTAQRNIPFFMIVMAAPVTLWLEEMVAAFSRAPITDSAGGRTDGDRVPGFPVFSMVWIAWIFVLLRAPGSPPKFRPEYDPTIYPERALTAVRQLGPSTRVATTDVWGGYLIYRLHPDVRVFWDGRADFYGTPYNLAAIDTLMGRPGWRKTLGENRITAVLLPVRQPLASLLVESQDWHAVYRDEVAVLFQLSADSNTRPVIRELNSSLSQNPLSHASVEAGIPIVKER